MGSIMSQKSYYLNRTNSSAVSWCGVTLGKDKKKKKRKRKSPLYSFTNSFSMFSLHSHKNMLSLATITYGNGKNKNSSCNDGKELGLSSGICFKDVSVEELGHASRQNCVFLSTWGKGHVARHSHKSLSPLASQAPANCLPTTISPLLHARN